MEINNTGSTYGAAFRQKPIFFMSGKETDNMVEFAVVKGFSSKLFFVEQEKKYVL